MDNQDSVSFFTINAQMGVMSLLTALELSPAVCRATLPPDLPLHVCTPEDPLPHGEYGTSLFTAIAQFEARFRTNALAPNPVLSQEEFLAAVAVLQPRVTSALEQAQGEVQTLTPPVELQADQERLLQYLATILETSRSVSTAAVNQDMDKIRGYIRSIDPVFCEARESFSPSFMQLVRNHFQGPPGVCTDQL